MWECQSAPLHLCGRRSSASLCLCIPLSFVHRRRLFAAGWSVPVVVGSLCSSTLVLLALCVALCVYCFVAAHFEAAGLVPLALVAVLPWLELDFVPKLHGLAS